VLEEAARAQAAWPAQQLLPQKEREREREAESHVVVEIERLSGI
jgi:hypothetical protein